MDFEAGIKLNRCEMNHRNMMAAGECLREFSDGFKLIWNFQACFCFGCK